MSDRDHGTKSDDAVPDGPSRPETVRGDDTPHSFLRRVTRPWHDGVEGAFAPFDLQTREGLSGFLRRQAMAVFPLERALERSGVVDRLADWPARRRSSALAADLLRLGVEAPLSVDIPDFSNASHMLGALYVLEGSKLGGRVLFRRVQASADPEVRAATAYLGHRHEHGWPGFLAVLDAVPHESGAWTDLREGARAAFAVFEGAAGSLTTDCFATTPTRSGLVHQAHA